MNLKAQTSLVHPQSRAYMATARRTSARGKSDFFVKFPFTRIKIVQNKKIKIKKNAEFNFRPDF